MFARMKIIRDNEYPLLYSECLFEIAKKQSKTQGMRRLRGECADSEGNAQTQGGMRRLRGECADSEGNAQT